MVINMRRNPFKYLLWECLLPEQSITYDKVLNNTKWVKVLIKLDDLIFHK